MLPEHPKIFTMNIVNIHKVMRERFFYLTRVGEFKGV